MSRRTHVSFAALAACAALLSAVPAAWAGPEVPGEAGKYAITGATVHTVTHGDVANATLVFENGRIVSIEANGPVPAGAKVIDQKGRHVYPGFVDANTQLGLIEVGTANGSNDTQEVGNVNPNLRAEVMVNPDSDLLPVARLNGITSALVIPGGGVADLIGLLRLHVGLEEATAAGLVHLHEGLGASEDRLHPGLVLVVALQLTGGAEDLILGVAEFAEVVLSELVPGEAAALIGEDLGRDARGVFGRGADAVPGGSAAVPDIGEEALFSLRSGHEPDRAVHGGDRGQDGRPDLVRHACRLVNQQERDGGEAADVGLLGRKGDEAGPVRQDE